MPDVSTLLPARRPELLIKPLGDGGRYVVKDPRSGEFFQLGEVEHFVLTLLDGARSVEAVCAAYAERFGEPLAEEDLDEFVELAHAQGFLQAEVGSRVATPKSERPVTTPRQNILYWRKSFFDPDRFFTWLAPRIWFLWTGGFLVCSACCIVAAIVIAWSNRHDLAAGFTHALRWETLALVWLTLIFVTLLHEFAHGLTCKHYGGEVHEVGFLLMFFLPCFYCNVSDAWLFKEKSKRLWVTFAGGYFELFLWALAVFVWRLTLSGTLVNYLAFVVLTLCGVQTLFNFNPLLKLDGYYLLSDWLEVPNLQQRSLDAFKGRLRWLLWGAPRPPREDRSKLLFRFGLVTWLYSLVFLALMGSGLFLFLWPSWGLLGIGLISLLGLMSVRGLFQGCAAGEIRNMITTRYKRTIVWLLILGGLTAVLCLVEMPDRPGGTFQIRPSVRVEVRAPVAGFLKEVTFDEGDRVSSGAVVARLHVPELPSRIAQKQAEVSEAEAKVRLLEIGPRLEEVAEQRRRVERAEAWLRRAQADLARSRQVLDAELARLDKEIAGRRVECDVAQENAERAGTLYGKRAIAAAEYREAAGKSQVAEARLAEAEAARRVRHTQGTHECETELARREKDLAEARALLKLLEAGSRPEEIQAARAALGRLQEEAKNLLEQRERQTIVAAVHGLVVTPRLREKVGQYFREGELICIVEETAALEVEILIAEQDVGRIEPGQSVLLRARALPLETLTAKLDRIAPVAGRGDVHTTVTAYCRLADAPPALRPGITGYARIDTGTRSVGSVIVNRIQRFVRTEFWLW